MKKVLTAMGNETLNKELCRYAKFEVSEEDFFYQEAVLIEIEHNEYDAIVLSGLLQGEFEICEFVKQVRVKKPKMRIVIVTDEVTSSYKRRMSELNVVDVFEDSTVSIEEIVDALDREESLKEKSESVQPISYINKNERKIDEVVKDVKKEYVTLQKQEVIVVTGTSGAGKSTIAVNFSRMLAKKTNSKVLIIDLDTLNGNIDEILDIHKVPQNVKIVLDDNKKCGLNYAVELINKNRFDTNILDELVIKTGNLDVLTGNTSLHYCQNVINKEHYSKILDAAKEKYDFIIIDTSNNIFLDSLKWAMQVATKVFFVTEANYLSMKKSTQLLNVFIENWNVWKEKIKIVVNKENLETLGVEVVEQILEEYEVIGKIKYMEEGLEHSYTQLLENTNFIPKRTFTSKLLAMTNLKEYMVQNSIPVNS
jgi:MinD-like ATPase involved in chromosome partitioning or flagellar assembly